MNIKKYLTLVMAAAGAVGTAAASPLDLNYEEMALNRVKEEGTLILSDCPEYARPWHFGRGNGCQRSGTHLLLPCQ